MLVLEARSEAYAQANLSKHNFKLIERLTKPIVLKFWKWKYTFVLLAVHWNLK